MIGTLVELFLWSPHIGTAAVLAATWTLVLIKVLIEEKALREQHGAAYDEYASKAPRWLVAIGKRCRGSCALAELGQAPFERCRPRRQRRGSWFERDPTTGAKSLKMPLPPPETARRIAHALSALADGLRGRNR